MSTLFSGHYLRNRSTLDIGVLGYIGIVQHKEHSPEVMSIPPGTPCINITDCFAATLPTPRQKDNLTCRQQYSQSHILRARMQTHWGCWTLLSTAFIWPSTYTTTELTRHAFKHTEIANKGTTRKAHPSHGQHSPTQKRQLRKGCIGHTEMWISRWIPKIHDRLRNKKSNASCCPHVKFLWPLQTAC